jgi:hypothetical protein
MSMESRSRQGPGGKHGEMRCAEAARLPPDMMALRKILAFPRRGEEQDGGFSGGLVR